MDFFFECPDFISILHGIPYGNYIFTWIIWWDIIVNWDFYRRTIRFFFILKSRDSIWCDMNSCIWLVNDCGKHNFRGIANNANEIYTMFFFVGNSLMRNNSWFIHHQWVFFMIRFRIEKDAVCHEIIEVNGGISKPWSWLPGRNFANKHGDDLGLSSKIEIEVAKDEKRWRSTNRNGGFKMI